MTKDRNSMGMLYYPLWSRRNPAPVLFKMYMVINAIYIFLLLLIIPHQKDLPEFHSQYYLLEKVLKQYEDIVAHGGIQIPNRSQFLKQNDHTSFNDIRKKHLIGL